MSDITGDSTGLPRVSETTYTPEYCAGINSLFSTPAGCASVNPIPLSHELSATKNTITKN
ncbi:MAG: hypothetical protein HYZ14_02225 [Bacteroidetes bacterium]|nr:hypothetical protein [Bacteroidota bacterium]